MAKPYKILHHNEYKLTIYNGITPLDPNDDNVDVEVTFPNGESFFAVFFTLQNINTLMQQFKKTGECASGLYFCAADMVIVQLLNEETICETIDALLIDGEFERVFSKDNKSKLISSNDNEDLFERFNETL